MVSTKWHPSPTSARALLGLGVPAARLQSPGVDVVADLHRPARGPEVALEVDQQRREAAVEADHQPVVAAVGDRRQDRLELVRVDRQGLFDEHRLAGPQGLADHRRVRVVARGDHHGVDRLVGQQAPVVGRAALEAEPALGVGGRQASGGRHLDQPDVGPVVQVRQEHAGGVVAGPDRRRGAPPAGGRAAGRCGDGQPALHRPVGRVAEQQADAALLAALDPLVGADRVVERQHRRDERVEVQPALGHQVQEAGHVAPLGPADIPDRVVDAALLVGRVVASGAVGAREADVQLLGVVLGPGQVEAALADVDDPRPVAGQLGGELDRLVGVAAGGEEDVVGPGAVGEGGRASPAPGRDWPGRAGGRRPRRSARPAGTARATGPDRPR